MRRGGGRFRRPAIHGPPQHRTLFINASTLLRRSNLPWYLATLGGLISAGAALAAGELGGGIFPEAGSPIIAVGDQMIDLVPRPLKDLAIDWFGTNDKIALLTGIFVVAAIFAAVLGLLARRTVAITLAGLTLFGIVGMAATNSQRQVGTFIALIPSAMAAVAGVVCAYFLLAPRQPAPVSDPSPGEPPRDLPGTAEGRRRFLVGAAIAVPAAGVLASGGRVLQGRNSATASREAVTLPRPVKALPPVPAGVSVGVDGVERFVTPNNAFYRIDINLAAPQVRTESYELKVHGMVDEELTFSYADLLDRPLNEYDITLTCVSNEIGGRLAGHARWLGFPIKELLEEAGVDPRADQLIGRSVDGFTTGYPVKAAYDRDAIVAIGMNGEPLPVQHGFPVRLITPGIYGYLSATKWLAEIELGRFDQFDQYWVKRGWVDEAPIRTLARIDTPKGTARVGPGKVAVAGVAWAQTRGITKVEVQFDDEPWRPARLADELNLDSWRQWVVDDWEPAPGLHKITARATDGTGETQPEERQPPFPSGATGWHSITVTVPKP